MLNFYWIQNVCLWMAVSVRVLLWSWMGGRVEVRGFVMSEVIEWILWAMVG